MGTRRSDPPPPPAPQASWLVGALDQRTDLVPPNWPETHASHHKVVQLPAVSDELARALRARGPKRPPGGPVDAPRRPRHLTPRSVRLSPEPAPERAHARTDRPSEAWSVAAAPAVAPAPTDEVAPQRALVGETPTLQTALAPPVHAPQGLAPAALAASQPNVPAWALGLLLLVLPPVGLALLWTSPAYGREARWALTAFAALTTFIGALFAVLLALC